MRTTLNLPRDLLAEAQKLSGARTKTQAIIWGLKELARRKRLEKLLALRGKIALSVNIEKSRAR